MTRQGKVVGGGKVRGDQLESIIVELLCVVRDDNIRNSKLINDVLPYKFLVFLSVILASGSTSIHFVKLSMATIENFFCNGA